MCLRFKKIAFIVLLIALSGTGAALAQALTPREQALKQQMLRETLREKMHGNYAGKADADEKAELLRTTGTGQRVTTNITSIQEAETSIAVNPNDSNKLVLSFIQENPPSLTTPIYYSSDGGRTWTRSFFNNQTVLASDFPGQQVIGGGDPTFAWDKQTGRLYFAWIYLSQAAGNDTGFFSLYWAYSDDNGHSWHTEPGEAHFIGQGAVNMSNLSDFPYKDGVCDREWLAVDNSGGPFQGTLYCSFINFAVFGESIKVKAPTDTAFGPIHLAFSGSSQLGNVEVDKNGTMHMSFADLGSSPNRVIHVSSTNAGTTFSAPHVISDGNNLFGSSTVVVHDRENAAPNMVSDGAGNLHIVWTDFPGSTVSGRYAYSTDNGVHWSTPLRLDSLFAKPMQTFMPTIAAFGNNVSISFTAIDSADSARYYQVISTDNGHTFGTPKLISTGATFYPDYNNTDFFGDYNRSVRTTCNTYAVWEDGRDGLGPKVYFASTNQCAPSGIREVTAVTGSLQVSNLYPNPATDKVTLQIEGTRDEQIDVTLYDIAGRQLLQRSFSIHSGTQQLSLPFSGISSGTYMLSVSNKDGLVGTRSVQVAR